MPLNSPAVVRRATCNHGHVTVNLHSYIQLDIWTYIRIEDDEFIYGRNWYIVNDSSNILVTCKQGG